MSDTNIPKHIAIIMDGNRRWAKKRNLPVKLGHKNGAESLRKIINYSIKLGIEYITVYAFSTENWKRSEDEVKDLMNLLREYLDQIEKDNEKKNVKIKILGDITRLDSDIQEKIINLENKTKDNTGLVFNIALNYGGRDEIIHAVLGISRDLMNKNIDEVNEEVFSTYLYGGAMPDPDIILRTAGEKRLSNFLLWQCAYSEFIYTDVLWPDFSEKDLDKAIAEFNTRKRNFGGR